MSMKSLKNCYINFSGSGNPNGKYWFIGVEPGGAFLPKFDDQNENLDTNFHQLIVEKSEEEFINYLNQNFIDEVTGNVYPMVFYILKKLYLKQNYFENNSRNKICFKSDGQAFYTNFSPLKMRGFKHKDNSKYLDFYRNVFFDFPNIIIEEDGDFSRETLFNSEWIKARSEKLSHYLRNESKIIFIMTATYENLIEKLLGYSIFTPINFVSSIKSSRTEFTIYKNKHLFVTLPQRGWSYSALDDLSKFIVNEI